MTQIKAKIFIGISVDPEEYTMPSDGIIIEELEDAVREYFHEIEGITIKTLKVTQQERIEHNE
tara:strand:- start:157 stop:345 length:189 start_codon:yes stop_codon:yes gene_type:complete